MPHELNLTKAGRPISAVHSAGDSYSDVGWVYPGCPLPTRDKPMGIGHPADWATWMSRSDWQDNWVQYLSRDRQANNHDLRIYNFAKGGSFVSDVETQVEQLADLLGQSDFQLERDKAVLVVWVGINDVGGLDHTLVEEAMDTIDDILGRCYRLGFRHLLLIDVPPRKLVKPGAKVPTMYNVISNNIEEWNAALEEQLILWTERSGTFGKIFSAHRLFENILTHPTQYDFEPSDPYVSGGGIWVDPIHPSTKVHELLFKEIKEELGMGLST